MAGVEAGNFPGKQRIARKLVAERAQNLAGANFILLPDISDSQENARKRRQVMTMCGRDFELGDALTLVSPDTTQPEDPAHRRRHAA